MVDLVTGAAGFIGSHLARELARRGGAVRGLVHRTPLSDETARTGVEAVSGDLREPGTLAAAFAGVDRVFHCAGLVTDWGRRTDFEDANVAGTAHALQAARAAGVRRFVHLSTTDVYGFPDRPVAEDAPLRKRGWPYGDTKIEGERLVWREPGSGGPEVVVVRPANVYGPGSLSFVAEIASLLRTGDMIHIGRRQRPAGLCHVDNLVDAVVAAAARPGAAGRAYNVTDDSGVTWREFTDGLADGIGAPRPRLTLPRAVARVAGWGLEQVAARRRRARRPLLTRMAVAIFTTHQDFAIGRARRELDYAPRRHFREALPELVGWLEGGTP